MCGIAGASFAPNESVNAKAVAKAMLLSIESRGWDATGFAYMDSTGLIQVHKAALDASKFVRRNLCLPKRAEAFIAHTRFSTQGDPAINDNNHPIRVNDIVGVHNGCLYNDGEIFRKLDGKLLPDDVKGTTRIAQVDSEAVFALLAHPEVMTQKDTLEFVRGSAAIAWMDRADGAGTLHLARIDGSPLICAETVGGSVLFASTVEAIHAGANAGHLLLKEILTIPEGTYAKVVNGRYEIVSEFTPDWSYGYRYTSYVPTPKTGKAAGKGYKVTDKRASAGTTTTVIRGPQHGITDAMSGGVAKDGDGFGNGVSEEEARDLVAVREYEQWWQENLQACEDAMDRDDDADDADDDTWLNAHLIVDPGFEIVTPSEEEYLAVAGNEIREETINDWMASLTCDGDAWDDAAWTLHADLRPGDTVVTDLDGAECYGHVVQNPVTFPHGLYVLRVYVPRKNRPGEFEGVFVARKCMEFKAVSGPANGLF